MLYMKNTNKNNESKYKTVGFGRIIASLAQVHRLCFDRKFKISKLLIIKNMEKNEFGKGLNVLI